MKASKIIAGCMKWGQWGANFTQQDYATAILHCIENGITSFDHADIYGDHTTEQEFGTALKNLPVSIRQKIELITKCGIQLISSKKPSHYIKHYNTSKQHIIQSCEQSLQNFHTDYIDCLLIHRPSPLMHADEMAEAFTILQQQGKVLSFGVSNFTPTQFALLHSRFPLITNQIQASIVYLQPFLDGTLDQCQQLGITPMAWSPVGGGNIFTAEDERSVAILEAANALEEKYNLTSDQLLLLWILSHPSNIYPVLGTARLKRITAAVEVLQHTMDVQDWFVLWSASTGQPIA